MLDADRTKLLRLLITVPEGRLMEAVTFPARETDLDIGCKTIGQTDQAPGEISLHNSARKLTHCFRRRGRMAT